MQTFAEKAAFYRQLGWPVFPLHYIKGHGTPNPRCSCGNPECARPGKHPLIRKSEGGHGKDDATTDSDQIDIWSDMCPEANIATVTGEQSGIMVIDIDGPAGEESVRQLEGKGCVFHETVTATSGRGRHLYYKFIRGMKTSTGKLAPGIDIRAEGAQIVLPPSLHYSGRVYTWVRSPIEGKPRLAPLWIPAMLEVNRQIEQEKAFRQFEADARQARYGSRRDPMEIIDRYAQRVATLPRKPGARNHTLNVEAFNAFRDVKKYGLDERTVFDKMMAAAMACGLGASEARGTINSARRGAYAKT